MPFISSCLITLFYWISLLAFRDYWSLKFSKRVIADRHESPWRFLREIRQVWFNIRTPRYHRHSFRACLFLRDVQRRDNDGHLSSGSGRMKLFILESAKAKDGNRNPIGLTHLAGCGILLSTITHQAHFSRPLYRRSTSFARCPLMLFAEFQREGKK
jgi:hypothetical protein